MTIKAIDNLRSALEEAESDFDDKLQKKLISVVIDSLFMDERAAVRDSSVKCIVPVYKKLSPDNIEHAFGCMFTIMSKPSQESRETTRTAWKLFFEEMPLESLPEERQDIPMDIQQMSVDDLCEKFTKYHQNLKLGIQSFS